MKPGDLVELGKMNDTKPEWWGVYARISTDTRFELFHTVIIEVIDDKKIGEQRCFYLIDNDSGSRRPFPYEYVCRLVKPPKVKPIDPITLID